MRVTVWGPWVADPTPKAEGSDMPASTNREAEAARPRGATWRLSFGDGLLFEVTPSGRKGWVLRYMLGGKRRDMGLGAFPAVSLKEARAKADAARKLAADKRDPIDARREEREAIAIARAAEEEQRARTFRDVAEALIKAQSPAWTSAKTLASWRLTLDKHGYPVLGGMPVADITRADVVRALSPIWTNQPPTARKLQRRISAVLDYAAAHGWRAADNPAAGRVLRLTKALPPVRADGHRWPSLPWTRVPAFITALLRRDGMSALALRFAILTVLRSNEIRQARWSEFDFDAGVWTLPGAKMKGGRAKAREAHRVPITPAMLDVLAVAASHHTDQEVTVQNLHLHAHRLRDGLVFSNTEGGTYSDAAMSATIKRMNADRPEDEPMPWRDMDGRPITQHGFRRSFRSWVDDERPEDAAAAEAQLAHEEPNKVTAAYRGSDLLTRRVVLMRAWADHCMGSASTQVIPLREALAG